MENLPGGSKVDGAGSGEVLIQSQFLWKFPAIVGPAIGDLSAAHGWSFLHLLQILARVQSSNSTRVIISRTALPYCTSLTVPFLKVTFMSGYT